MPMKTYGRNIPVANRLVEGRSIRRREPKYVTNVRDMNLLLGHPIRLCFRRRKHGLVHEGLQSVGYMELVTHARHAADIPPGYILVEGGLVP